MNGRTIYHVEIKGNHSYFGSVSAIYEVYSAEELNVSMSRLYSYGIKNGRPYKNKFCTIRRGLLIRKQKRYKKTML